MDEIERRRLQALVDAVHLTSAAVSALPGTGTGMAASAWGRMRADGIPLGTTWRPRPVPRGWLPILLGTESPMYVPYLSPFLSHVMPMYPGVGSPGLIHSGVGHIGSGIPMGMSPIPYGSPYMTPGIYGYRPIPYGVGLVHAGYDGSIPGGISPSFGINPMMGIGPSMMGGIPSMSMGPGIGSMMPMGSMSMPMQPAWSPMQPMQSPMPTV